MRKRRKHDHRDIAVTYEDKQRALRLITAFNADPFHLYETCDLSREEIQSTLCAVLMVNAITLAVFADTVDQDPEQIWQTIARKLALDDRLGTD